MKTALLLSTALALIAGQALAAQTPTPGKKDGRIQYQAYDPDDIVEIRGVLMWGVMTVEYGLDETPINASPANSEILHVDPPHNNIQVWQFNGCLKNSPVFTFTQNAKTGEQRSYKFRVTTQPDNCDAVGQPVEPDSTPGVSFQKASAGGDPVVTKPAPPKELQTLKFTYPGDAAAAAKEKAKVNHEKRERGRANQILQQQPEYRDPFNPLHRNVKFFGHGDETIAPDDPDGLWDDGFTTVFRYSGNRPVPTFYRTLPDGRTSKVNCTMYGGNAVLCEGTSQIWRMTSGNAAYELYNTGYTAAGQSPNTGTTSPFVQRVIKGGGDDR